jgi:hypothetical protein
MTESAVAYTDLSDSAAAGAALGGEIARALPGAPPDAVILFASSRYDYPALLEALAAACQPGCLVGSSSAGELNRGAQGEGMACAVALRAPEMRFTAGIARDLGVDRAAAARQLTASFRGIATHDYLYRSALVLTDALAGLADELVEQLTVLTGGMYQLFGGGAGDDAHFERTHVFCGTEAVTNAAVALEILSNKPVGIGVAHGWEPASGPMRVTEAEGARLVSLNAVPVAEVLQEHAEATGQRFDPADPLPFFLHNILGIETDGGYKLRVPLGVAPDGAIVCAAEIPAGATIRIMRASVASSSDAAARATTAAIAQLHGLQPRVALFFDCVATRLRMGRDFGVELRALQDVLGTADYAGCNTYGQIARAEGQFSGFHNCTAVVCAIP